MTVPKALHREPLLAAEYPTPFGPLVVVVTPEDGMLRASGFRPLTEVAEWLSPGHASRGWQVGPIPHVADAVAAWLAGDAQAIVAVEVEQDGGEFFQQVWRAMREIPAGEPASYAELAADAGRPRAVRAAGSACARNRLAPFVPCHRVVKTGGDLGNYGYGLDIKEAMLAMEAAPLAHATAL
jgi:methylated-DNA-[protein]-cysteine S-methyltransferase